MEQSTISRKMVRKTATAISVLRLRTSVCTAGVGAAVDILTPDALEARFGAPDGESCRTNRGNGRGARS